MEVNLTTLDKKITEAIQNITPEEIKLYFPSSTIPKGWVSVEHHLPMMFAIDIRQGYSAHKVKNNLGEEFTTMVSDHNVWYQQAKQLGITHWWNE